MNYQQAIEFIQSFPDAERGLPGVKPSRSLKMPLSTMKALLEKLGNPQNAASTIHITGSKGKGSTATFIASILKQAGLPTALFTSPHIHSYTERIVFDGQPVSENIFAQGITELKPLIEEFDRQGHTVSTFGVLATLFFHLVKAQRTRVDAIDPYKADALWQVVEVGLGGKDDLTNVFEQKEVVVITPISLEHTAILGSTPSAIAENKGGIITPGCVVVLASQPDKDVVNIIRKICAKKEAELIDVGADAISPFYPLPYPIQLHGEHQITNAMTALVVIHALEKRKKIMVTEDATKEGLAQAFLPGRFEIIEHAREHGVMQSAPTGPSDTALLTRAQQSNNIIHILDGAHNGDSAQALAKTLHQVFPDRPVILIIGVSQDKDLEGIWQELKDYVSIAVATRSNNYRSLLPEEITKRISACDQESTVHYTNNIEQALQHANELAQTLPDSIICVCGSLYLVAEAREKLLHTSEDAVPAAE